MSKSKVPRAISQDLKISNTHTPSRSTPTVLGIHLTDVFTSMSEKMMYVQGYKYGLFVKAEVWKPSDLLSGEDCCCQLWGAHELKSCRAGRTRMPTSY